MRATVDRELPTREELETRTEWFFVAYRDIGWVAGSLTITATQLSAATLVGAVGIHYLFGVSFVLVWVGIWLGWLVSLLYIAPQLRRFGGVTVPEFLGARFPNDGADGARVQALAAVLVATIYLVFTAAQYVAGGVLVETILGVPAIYGMIGIMGVTLAYTAAGGMRASVLTDVVLAVVVFVGLLVAVWHSLSTVGGIGTLYVELIETNPGHLGVAMPAADLLSFGLAFGLSLAVGPYQISRIYAMENERTVRISILAAIGMQTVVAACVLLLGLIAVVTFPDLADPDAAVPELIRSLLGPVASTLLLIGIVAAILSTVDSVLLVSASAIAYDLYASVFLDERGSADTGADHRTFWVARLATVAAAVVPLGLALSPGLLGELVQVIAALFGALIAGTLFVPVLLGIQWGRATTGGAVAGMLAGFVTVVVWHLVWTVYDVAPGPLEYVPPTAAGVLASAVAMVAVSVGR
ncbi:sodium:solute symporter family protein [Natrialbaceae archaeon A-gly3]